MRRPLAVVKGAGELGTGVAHLLSRRGFCVVALEKARPFALRRAVSFAEAVYETSWSVHGVAARWASCFEEALDLADRTVIPVLIDPEGRFVAASRPDVLIDAVMARRNTGTTREDAPTVVALGPGFAAGEDCHAVIETNRGPSLGRVVRSGSAEQSSGVPAPVNGFTSERVLRAEVDGAVRTCRDIGESVLPGEVVCRVERGAVVTPIGGVVRGVVRDGTPVFAGKKIADIDPRGDRSLCYSFSDKATEVAAGVLRAIGAMPAHAPSWPARLSTAADRAGSNHEAGRCPHG